MRIAIVISVEKCQNLSIYCNLFHKMQISKDNSLIKNSFQRIIKHYL